jgi:hypothetical protein
MLHVSPKFRSRKLFQNKWVFLPNENSDRSGVILSHTHSAQNGKIVQITQIFDVHVFVTCVK